MGKWGRALLFIAVMLCSVASASATEVRISAAASLREAVTELARVYGRQNPGTTFLCNFGASGMLAQQIENGAPADLFISANPEWMEHLKGKGVLQGESVRPFTFNSLVFVSAAQKKVSSLQDLLKLDRIAIGSPKSVPAGAYAQEALTKAGLLRQLEKRLVLAKDVRECLMYAERGDVDGAFVYRTDALQAKKATVRFTLPQGLLPRIMYPMALTATGARNSAAAGFYRFLEGGTARSVLARYGFAGR